MNFMEALNAMVDRKCVAREAWFVEEPVMNKDGTSTIEKKLPIYLMVLPNLLTVFQVTPGTSVNVANYLFRVEDYQAEDWIFV